MNQTDLNADLPTYKEIDKEIRKERDNLFKRGLKNDKSI